MSEFTNTTIGPFSGLVPQFFFDFIARVAPGIFLLLCAYFLIYKEPCCFVANAKHLILHFHKAEGTKIFLVIGLIFVSYFLAIITEGIYFLLKRIFKRKWHAWLGTQIDAAREDTSHYITQKGYTKKTADSIFYEPFIMYDEIRLMNPSAGSRLVKLRAEYYMARVLVIGSFVLAACALAIFPLKGRTLLSLCITELLLIGIAIIFICIFVQRRKTFFFGVHNHWAILKVPDTLNNLVRPAAYLNQHLSNDTPDT